MDQISRPMMALLVATLAIAGLWFTLLKPKPGAGGNSSASPSPSALQSDVTKAHQAVATADRAAVAQGGGAGSASSSATTTPATTNSAPPAHTNTLANAPAHVPPTKTTAQPATKPASKSQLVPPATEQRADTVANALEHHRVVAALFYNPAGADDQAVKRELASISTHRGRVVKLTIPIGELAGYPVITQQVPVTESPTLVLIDRNRQATTLVGFADAFSIGQRLDTVLAVK